MQRLLDKGLEDLTTMVYKMGQVAEKALSISINRFVECKDSSKDVQELSEILVSTTAEVEEKAFSLIVKYQPVASDLRIINSYMKVAYDFERFGRYAYDISYLGKHFADEALCNEWIYEYISQMAEKVLQMVGVSINSLKKLDAERSKVLVEMEQEVDDMYFKYLDKLVEKAGVTNKCTVASVLAVRYLERIGDYAVQIMEDVVYIATGEKVTLR